MRCSEEYHIDFGAPGRGALADNSTDRRREDVDDSSLWSGGYFLGVFVLVCLLVTIYVCYCCCCCCCSKGVCARVKCCPDGVVRKWIVGPEGGIHHRELKHEVL